MQTSPCRVFKIPIPCCLIWRSPDRVHGGWIRLVKKANNVYRQKIIVPSDFVCCSWCESLSPGWCLKKGKGDQWEGTSSRGGATMQTSPCRVFRIPIPRFLKYGNPDRVHGAWIHYVNKADNVGKQNIIVLTHFVHYPWCESLSPGWCLKKGEGDQWEWTSNRGGATMQTSPCRVFKSPILRFLKYGIPNKVHGGRPRDVNTSNICYTQNIIVSSDNCDNI